MRKSVRGGPQTMIALTITETSYSLEVDLFHELNSPFVMMLYLRQQVS